MGCNISARQQSLITQDPRKANHSTSEATETTMSSPTHKKNKINKGKFIMENSKKKKKKSANSQDIFIFVSRKMCIIYRKKSFKSPWKKIWWKRDNLLSFWINKADSVNIVNNVYINSSSFVGEKKGAITESYKFISTLGVGREHFHVYIKKFLILFSTSRTSWRS